MSRYRSHVRDVSNRNTAVRPELERGFNAFLPVYDGGVHFVLYREGDSLVRKVQLKSRRTIEPEFAVGGIAGRMAAPSLSRPARCLR
jgi:hypothetical protein